MYNWDNSAPVVNACTFILNHADHGGGVYNDHSNATLVDCLLQENSADFEGGALYNYAGTVELTRCVLYANTAALNGGGVYTEEGEFALANCVLYGNQANLGGGVLQLRRQPRPLSTVLAAETWRKSRVGAFYNSQGDPVFTNCTLAGNHAESEGGGIYSSGDCAPVLSSCILWGNTDSHDGQQSSQLQGGSPGLEYCCIQDWNGSLGGVGNTGLDPSFANADGADGVVGTLDDDLRLSSQSLSIGRRRPHVHAECRQHRP